MSALINLPKSTFSRPVQRDAVRDSVRDTFAAGVVVLGHSLFNDARAG